MSPGLNHNRLLNLMRAAVDRCRLDLRATVVLTEAATGAYGVTPVLAAMAGAETVFAMTRDTRYGTVEQVRAVTLQLAELAGYAGRINVISQLTPAIIGSADIVTNSGHVRPIDSEFVSHMKRSAVIPLMYEAWEFRESDLELDACRERGIQVAGTNERIPQVDVFSYLGVMAVKLLLEAGIAVYRTRVLTICDNSFDSYIEEGLEGAGATVTVRSSLAAADPDPATDAILIATRPQNRPVIGTEEARQIARSWPGAILVQFWGDVDREALSANGVPFWPERGPAAGHMAILPSSVGPEAIVRLQSGGLKVGETLLRSARSGDRSSWEFVDEL